MNAIAELSEFCFTKFSLTQDLLKSANSKEKQKRNKKLRRKVVSHLTL
jgi:hypothetical protein